MPRRIVIRRQRVQEPAPAIVPEPAPVPVTNEDRIAALRAKYDSLPPRDKLFADSLLGQYARKGYLSDKQWPYVDKLVRGTAEREKVEIGGLEAVNRMFDKAAQHRRLKAPAIVLLVGFDNDHNPCTVRLSVAGENSRAPGTINVKDHDVDYEPVWYGRILKDGNFEFSPRLDKDDRENGEFIVGKLREFAADPIRVASEHGRLTGRCCFCNIRLKDERSTAMGYGPVCAENFGLELGREKHSFAAEAVS